MPFKLKLSKTRNYSIVSKNIQILTVELIDRTLFETTAPSDATGLYCMQVLCQKLNLQQPEFFGFRYVSKKPYPKVRWIELEKPLKKQLEKYALSSLLYFGVQYYVHDVGLMQDDVTRNAYFMQVKNDVLDGKIKTNKEQAVLLASYSMQADWGDYQEERHNTEFILGYPLFPKLAVGENEISRLLEAVLWQYSCLKGLEPSLAETYYIQEAQRLPGYGQETFIARDEKACEVYLGTSVRGIIVQSSSGEHQKFFRWNTITNLSTNKRVVFVSCALPGEHARFTFDETDAAKYIWKVIIKQHTFYKGNQDVFDIVVGADPKNLAIPDLQSSVMDSTIKSNVSNFSQSTSIFDAQTKPSFQHDVSFDEQNNPRNLSQFSRNERTQPSKSQADSTQPKTIDAHARLRLMSQRDPPHMESHFKITQKENTNPSSKLQASGFANNSAASGLPNRLQHSQSQSSLSQNLQQFAPKKEDFKEALSKRLKFLEALDDAERQSLKRKLLPQYRIAPDYNSAVVNKYGGLSDRGKLIHSSQPEISLTDLSDSKREDLLFSPRRTLPDIGTTMVSDSNNAFKKITEKNANLVNTYSSPDLVENDTGGDRVNGKEEDSEIHFIYGNKPPPPYAASKASSNSTPDLVSTLKAEERIPEAYRKRSLLTSSLGCLGSPDLSRTYENLSVLNDAVESLRQELTRSNNGPTYLHSVPPNYSQDNLNNIYQLNANVTVDLRDSVNSNYSVKQTIEESQHEPIYQNVNAIIAEIAEQQKARAKSTSELELVCKNLGLDVTILQCDNQPIYDDYRPRTNSYPLPIDPQFCRSVEQAVNPLVAESIGLRPTINEITNMGSISSCISSEDNKNKPDILTNTMVTKIVSKDSRVIDLRSKLNSMEIVNEFESIPRIKANADFTTALLPENSTKNQYKDIVPYEENRVKLTPTKENRTGYINASHITASVGSNQRFYICSQGPLASTVGHFWQNVWESDVRLIVMLNSVTGDGGTSKSFPYWPLSDNTSVECDQYRIYRKHSTKSSHHVTSRLQLVNVGQKSSRSVWHLQFTDWADHGCPEDVESFITFLEEMSTLRRVTFSEVEGVGRNKNTPVLVHCSAGVGRSGVTIICDILLDTADHNLPINVPKVLLHLRQQRMCLVQSFNQYKFIYKVLLSYLEKSRLI